MCEILGFSAQDPQNINGYLRTFYSHSVAHPDGWGLATFEKGHVCIRKEPVRAIDSQRLPKVLDHLGTHQVLMAHIRLATVGSINPKNCHPFSRRDNSGVEWTLIHNGTIFNGLELFPYESQQKGSTDSERVLLYLVDQMNHAIGKNGGPLSPEERFLLLEQAVKRLSYRNKLNLLLYDGTFLYVHTNMLGTLHYKTWENSVLFSTAPLEETGWHQVPMTTLLVYRDGKLLRQGENHHTEFFDTLHISSMEFEYNI
ncbi:MAG: class II glutamine amidotransferase [Oscillospiraceae bacterium]|nr:class II glutamine amidotransferase [Oscillospiraceae bacterium]